MLLPRGKHQQRLGLVRHRLREQQLAQRFAERRPAGLARTHDAMAARGKRVGKPRSVRALTGAVDPFKGNETPADDGIGHLIGSLPEKGTEKGAERELKRELRGKRCKREQTASTSTLLVF